jgi:hypothetical protein
MSFVMAWIWISCSFIWCCRCYNGLGFITLLTTYREANSPTQSSLLDLRIFIRVITAAPLLAYQQELISRALLPKFGRV